MTHGTTYDERRSELREYFDRTALEAWARLTSSAPLGRIRASVRNGREAMRARLLAWLPADLRGRRLLDAGCGTGALAVDAARRGAQVLAVDLSPRMVALAAERAGPLSGIEFRVGDMLDPALGEFDHVVAMDSLIHYRPQDAVRALAALAARTRRSIVFTFAPRTLALSVMHCAGRLFPRASRAPAIEPVSEARLRALLSAEAGLAAWRVARSERVRTAFYHCQAMALERR